MQTLFSHSGFGETAELLHFFQGDADAVDQDHTLWSKGLVQTLPLNGWEDRGQRGRVTFPRYFIRLEEGSQVSTPVSCHLASLVIQSHGSRGKCF